MASILDIKRYCSDRDNNCNGCYCKSLCKFTVFNWNEDKLRKMNDALNSWAKTHPGPTYLDELLKRMPALKGHEEEFIKKTCVETMFDTKVRNSDKTCPSKSCTCCWEKEYKGEK